MAHVIIWVIVMGEWPESDIDHENRVRNDNRWFNLRRATRTQNIANQKVRVDSLLGLKGVSRNGGKFSARLGIARKRMSLGTFKTAQEAHAAYLAKATEVFGKFACKDNSAIAPFNGT